MKRKNLTKQQVKEVIQLFKNGNSRARIVEITGAHYQQVCHAIAKVKKYKRVRRVITESNTNPNYTPSISKKSYTKSDKSKEYAELKVEHEKLKDNYRKAVKLLVENDLLEIEL